MTQNTLTETLQDLFNRSQFFKKLDPLIDKCLAFGGAIALHAPFGMGKTTFCNLYSNHLNKDENCKITIIDSLKNDYELEPFNIINKKILELTDKENSHKLKKL